MKTVTVRSRWPRLLCLAATLVVAAGVAPAGGSRVLAQSKGKAIAKAPLRFEISVPASVHPEPITGRVYVMISRTNDREPRLQIGRTGVPFFGRDVERLTAGHRRDHRRDRSRVARRQPRRHPAGRLLRPGVRQRLLRVQARRRPRRLDARRPVGGAALQSLARQPLQRGAAHPHRSCRRGDDQAVGQPGDSADRRCQPTPRG